MTNDLTQPVNSVDEGQKRTFLAPAKAARTPLREDEVSHSVRELPSDLLLEASKRLQVLSLLLASTIFLAHFLGHLLDILIGDIDFFRVAPTPKPPQRALLDPIPRVR